MTQLFVDGLAAVLPLEDDDCGGKSFREAASAAGMSTK